MRKAWAVLLIAVFAAPVAVAQPPTVYEAEGNDIPPQMMDFDAENNRFRAHPGWIDGNEIHYYKFRMYVPPNYQTDAGGLDNVPIAPLYLPSTDGTFAGIPDGAEPILRFHTADGTSYSDFVEIVFYEPGGRATSYDDIAGRTMTPTGIVANVPLVPTGSTLEDPTALGTDLDEVMPWMAWYDDEPVQTFVFESTSQDFADYINPLTRTPEAAEAGSGWESVVAQFATTSGVSAIPIWHVNQYQTGVTAGVNNGGPSGIGQRNVIDADRLDPGYSPLWQVWWATQVPVGFSADDATSADAISDENGFAIAKTPMFVNCPNLGPHGGTPSDHTGEQTFATTPDVSGEDSVLLEGSIPMQDGVELQVKVNGDTVGETTTGMMGLYTYTIDVGSLDEGANTVTFERTDGTTVGSFDLENPGSSNLLWWIIGGIVVVGAVLFMRKKDA